MDVITRLGTAGIIPVVVIDEIAKAIETADALSEGGLDVMEITLRTPIGLNAIEEISKNRPTTLVGAGTVLTLEQCERAYAKGAQFIVSPGFSPEIAEWCANNLISYLPGCVTPTEITSALKYGLSVFKFFPANVYGGLSGIKALSAPFTGVKFVPTGGVSLENLTDYAMAPFIHAVGGSWICSRDDIAKGNFTKITELTKAAVQRLMGFSFKHLGINTENSSEAENLAEFFSANFGFDSVPGNSSIMVDNGSLEVIRTNFIGAHGHLAILTNSIPRAIAHLEKKNIYVDQETAKFKGDRCVAVYLRDEVHGFGIHLLQK